MTPMPQSRIRWLLLFSIFAMSAITYLDRVNISISGRWLAQEYDFSDIRLGWVFSAFVVGYALFQVPAGAGWTTLVLAGGAGTRCLAQSSFWALTADVAGSSAGSVSGLMNLGAQTGGALTASLTPFIATHLGWTASFATASTLCALGAAAWLLVNLEKALL